MTAAVCSAILGQTVSAVAQAYPTRPVTLIVPFPPGGVIDTTARVLESELSKELGQPVVIENKGGSGGNLGTQLVARAQPDGHTLLLAPNSTVVTNPFTFRNYPIDPVKDLAAVGMVGETYVGLVVPASSPFNSVQDIIKAAKQKPAEFTYGHIGIGSAHNIAGALLNKKADIDITPVPFQGAGPAMQSLLGGHITMSYGTLAGILPYVEAKQMKLIAIAEPKRIQKLPDIATMGEAVPGVEATVWVGVFAPGGTPKPVVDKLNAALNKIVAVPDIQAKLDRIGVVPKPASVAAFEQRVRDDLKFWKQAVELAGIAPQ
jgi:tripartite-type tricarboxylate transporter receptor subunit TctC